MFGERQDSDRRLGGQGMRDIRAGWHRTSADFEHSHRIGDVLKHDIAHILKGMTALAAHLVVHFA
jgi:hypothetical protein